MEPKSSPDSFGTFLEIMQAARRPSETPEEAASKLLAALSERDGQTLDELLEETRLSRLVFVAGLERLQEQELVETSGPLGAEQILLTDRGRRFWAIARSVTP